MTWCVYFPVSIIFDKPNTGSLLNQKSSAMSSTAYILLYHLNQTRWHTLSLNVCSFTPIISKSLRTSLRFLIRNRKCVRNPWFYSGYWDMSGLVFYSIGQGFFAHTASVSWLQTFFFCDFMIAWILQGQLFTRWVIV